MSHDEWLDAYERGIAVAYWAATAPDRPAVISPVVPRSAAAQSDAAQSDAAQSDAAQSDAAQTYATQTYAELNARVNQLVRTLRAQGLVPGSGVVAMLGNRSELVWLYLACQRAGWRFTPVNWHLTPAEACYIVADSEARAFVADGAIDHAVGTAAQLAAGAGEPRARYSVGGAIPGTIELAEAMSSASGLDIDDPVRGTPMLYTSGTTGHPKGVRRDEPAPAVLDPAIYPAGSVHLLTGPLYHAAPLAITCHPAVCRGGTLVMMDHWDPEENLRLIDRHQVTHTHLVPTMFHRLLGLPDEVKRRYDLSSLRVVVHGAAPCPVSVKRSIIEWFGPVVYEYYAATEGAGTLVDSHTWLAHPGTVGRPHPRGQVIVGDDEAEPLPDREIGTVWLRAPAEGRFRYHGDDGKTASSYRGEYFTLHDLGFLDDDGYLYLTDRSANLIISGGVNIYPAEIDAVLHEHPAVADVATIGVPDDEWGEQVKAVVQLRDGSSPSDDLAHELVEFCRDRLAHFKCPRSVDFVDALPRHDTGKIYKRLLRDQYRER